MKRNLNWLIFPLLLLLVGGQGAFAQGQGPVAPVVSPDLQPNVVTVARTRVAFQPPMHFQAMDTVSGWGHPGAAAGITFQVIEGQTYPIVSSGITPEVISRQGATLVEQGEMTLQSGKQAKYFLMEFTIREIKFLRLMLFTGDLSSTILVNATFPEMTRQLLMPVIIESLKTVRYAN